MIKPLSHPAHLSLPYCIIVAKMHRYLKQHLPCQKLLLRIVIKYPLKRIVNPEKAGLTGWYPTHRH